MSKIFKFFLLLIFTITITGCDLLKRDTMEDIGIITTIYPLEFVTNRLYGNNALINSIYPDETNVDTYTFTEKQIKDFSKKDLFIYMGNTNDTDQAVNFLNKNKKIKLIDATFGMQYKNDIEELWLNPSNLLMISQNIKNGLNEYINSTYLIKEIENNYDALQIELSELDANIKLSIENAEKKVIFANDKSLKYLEKYGLTVIVLNENDSIYEKNLTIINKYIANKKVSYIFILENTTIPEEIKNLIDNGKLISLTYRNLKNITDKERSDNIDYIDIAKENLELLKKELY